MRGNGQQVFSALGAILKLMWKAALLMTFLFCKVTEQLAGFIASLCERYMD